MGGLRVEHILVTADEPCLELLCTAMKVVAAVGCLEELQRVNAAKVVVMLAWNVRVFGAEDHGA